MEETERISDGTHKDSENSVKEPEWRQGRRIEQLGYMADQLVCEDSDTILNLKNVVNETRHGYGSLLYVECSSDSVLTIETNRRHEHRTKGPKIFYVNTKAALGDAKAFEGENWEYFEEYREKTGEKEILNDILPKVESFSEYSTKLDKGCKVLDLGCGTGILTMCMAERHPKSSFVGIDVIDDCLHRARVQCKKKGLSNVRFTNTTLESFIGDLEEELDLVTSFQVLHNLPDPITTIQHLHSLLKPSGKLILSEIDVSSNHLQNVGNISNAFLYAVSLFYCLNYSMSDKPHVGYGVGWGKENMLKALKEYFILDVSFQLGFSTRLYLLSKRATL